MDNKLSELKAAAAKYTLTLDAHRENPKDRDAVDAWDTATEEFSRVVNNDEMSIIIALLAELEGKDKRIAELERANQSQDDHINQQQDRIESLEKKNGDLGRAFFAAEKRLVTPVRLPRPACTYADHSYPAYSRKQVEGILTSAGMCFTVEGDE